MYELIGEMHEEYNELKQQLDLYKSVIDEVKKYMEAHESDVVDYYGTLFYELGQYEEIKKILDKAKVGDKE